MIDELETIVRRHIAGLCDSYVLHLACLATDNDFIEMARQRPACIQAVHKASERVCPDAVRNDSAFFDHLIFGIKRSVNMPARQYLVDELRNLESCLNREHVFALATLPKTSWLSLARLPFMMLGGYIRLDTRSRYAKFVQDKIDARTIDANAALSEILNGLAGDDVPARYREGIAKAYAVFPSGRSRE